MGCEVTRERLRPEIPGLSTVSQEDWEKDQEGLTWGREHKESIVLVGFPEKDPGCVCFIWKVHKHWEGLSKGKAAGKGRGPSQLPLWGTGPHAVETLRSIV